ncbi:MAG: TonB-dependent receptor, partial [Hyphomonadaceae bacterium]
HTGAKEVYGLELGVFATMLEGDTFSVPLRFTYTYTDGEYKGGGRGAASALAGDVLEYTPPHIASLQIGLEHKAGWDFYTALSYLDETCSTMTCDRPGIDDTFLRTERLVSVDLSASYDLSDAVELYAKVDNLFDERAITNRGADGARGNPGRYAGLGLRVNF